MSKNKIILNSDGVRDLLKSQAMQNHLKEIADEIKHRSGDGYESDVYVGKNRANAMVRAESIKAKTDNMKNNTLLKAVK